MPHLVIQCGVGVSASEAESLLRDAHQALLGSGEVRKPEDLKSRVIRTDLTLVGAGDPSSTFVHAELRLLTGRSPETRQRLADLALEALGRSLRPEVALSVEVVELAAAYAKRPVR